MPRWPSEHCHSGNTKFIKNSQSCECASASPPHLPHRSFQQALYRNVSEKNAQLEKRLENVIREGESPYEVSFVARAEKPQSERRDQPFNKQAIRYKRMVLDGMGPANLINLRLRTRPRNRATEDSGSARFGQGEREGVS